MTAKAAYLIIALFLVSFYMLPKYIEFVEGKTAEIYQCPPCGCSGHEIKYKEIGKCQVCWMRLIPISITEESSYSEFFAPLFKLMQAITPYYHKILYPSYLVAFTLIIFVVVNYRKRPSVLLISAYLLCLTLYAFKHQLYGTNFSLNWSNRLIFFPISFLLILGPILYLYIKSFDPEPFKISKEERLHFIPALLIMALNSIVIFFPENLRSVFIYNSFDSYFSLSEHLIYLIVSPYYLTISYRQFKQKEIIGTAKIWLMSAFVFQITFTILAVFLTLINFSFYDMKSTFIDYYFLWFYIALFIYWSIYFFSDKKGSIFPQTIYRRLSDDILKKLIIQLDRLTIDEKPFLNPDLNLAQLAEKLSVTSKELSELLNKGYQQSFYDYINFHRVNEVKKLLIAPNKQNLTNDAIAEEAGFKSKSTFINSFRKIMQQTPGEYKRDVQ